MSALKPAIALALLLPTVRAVADDGAAAMPTVPREPVVFAHFYYWYPINAAICTHHAPAGHLDRDDVDWWKGELRSAAYAGIDVLDLMYWDVHDYNPAALRVLCRALREMNAAGEVHPLIAMHLDGIEHCANIEGAAPVTTCDLTDPARQEAVLKSFVHFFAVFREEGLLDECFRQGGRLVAFVYRPEYGRVRALADKSMVDLWHRRFREETGDELYVVLEDAYFGAKLAATGTDMHCTNADNYFRWDPALAGPMLEERGEFPVATIGPGWDASGQGPQAAGRSRDRRDGDTFREDFAQAAKWRAPWLVIETFNFFEEGTDITETQEFGRLYLEIAHEWTARLKAAGAPRP
jgi:hypothetical protein